jgi:hypothetical protein
MRCHCSLIRHCLAAISPPRREHAIDIIYYFADARHTSFCHCQPHLRHYFAMPLCFFRHAMLMFHYAILPRAFDADISC